MKLPKELLSRFSKSLQEVLWTQQGNFVEAIRAQFPNPQEAFLHLICRKIDIKAALFCAYDPIKDLRPTSDEPLDDTGWTRIIWILAYFYFTSESPGIRYKALNTLFKARGIHPLNDPCVEQLYSLIGS